ncbi:MAG: hypothetical protein PHP39_06995, partial [Oscillospiraceae bacterium]|nr:hypothetical protein [Oscillospiraceae bacterium]
SLNSFLMRLPARKSVLQSSKNFIEELNASSTALYWNLGFHLNPKSRAPFSFPLTLTASQEWPKISLDKRSYG